WPESSQPLVASSRRARAARTSSSPVTAALAPGTRRAAARTSPGRISTLLGMHAQYEHSPPTSSRSTSATRRPPSPHRPAAFSPAGPAPTTTTSYVAEASVMGRPYGGVPACGAPRGFRAVGRERLSAMERLPDDPATVDEHA